MEKLILRLRKDHPKLLFSPGRSHCWSPGQGQISYEDARTEYALEGLLHELGHARLGHKGYNSDIELLKKEVEAWQEALQLSQTYGVEFDREHMQDCLDTYRDWIYKRSMCPVCLSTGLQKDERHYTCLNCGHDWLVTSSRFRRPYRRSKAVQNKKS
jgi:hypothetical protein